MNKSIIGIALAGGLLATGLAGTALAADQLRTQDRDQLHVEDPLYTQDRLPTRDRINLYTESDGTSAYSDGSRKMVQERAEYRYRVMDGGTSMNGGASGNGNSGKGKGR